MVHYFNSGYMVRTHPVHLPDRNLWQVQFTITCHDYPLPKTGKTFTFQETFNSEKKAADRCTELADAIIRRQVEGQTLQMCEW
jgi:hypothetical protein